MCSWMQRAKRGHVRFNARRYPDTFDRDIQEYDYDHSTTSMPNDCNDYDTQLTCDSKLQTTAIGYFLSSWCSFCAMLFVSRIPSAPIYYVYWLPSLVLPSSSGSFVLHTCMLTVSHASDSYLSLYSFARAANVQARSCASRIIYSPCTYEPSPTRIRNTQYTFIALIIEL